MKIKKIKLKGFKRFTDMTMQEIPETARLIILAGPNGCGKSSFFDGLKSWHKNWKGAGKNWQADYHQKQGIAEVVGFSNAIQVEFHGVVPTDADAKKKAVYIRTAYRNDPQFKLHNLERVTSQLDEERFGRLIDNDAAVGQNYKRLASRAFGDLFKTYDENATIKDFREHVIGDIKASINRVFPELHLHNLGDPLEDGTFYFEKGQSHKFDYQNLSGGEKSAFDLILDMVVKRRDYDDTVFCVDEPELHMNTRLQGALLEEMYNLINEKSQLWISTHSIGMMRKAKDLAVKYPGTVVFLDFDQRDFDKPQVMEPVKISRAFWENILRVALDDLAELVTPQQIVICEGTPAGTAYGPNVAHDAECLDAIFSNEFPETKFIAGGNCHDIAGDRLALIGVIQALSQGADVIRMIDRDDRSPQEISDLEKDGIMVLGRRNLESYIFDDEVLKALCSSFGQAEKLPDVLAAKVKSVTDSISRGNPADDLKKAAGSFYNDIRKILSLTAKGQDYRAFMRSTLSPLITPDMAVYQTLKNEIFKTAQQNKVAA